MLRSVQSRLSTLTILGRRKPSRTSLVHVVILTSREARAVLSGRASNTPNDAMLMLMMIFVPGPGREGKELNLTHTQSRPSKFLTFLPMLKNDAA